MHFTHTDDTVQHVYSVEVKGGRLETDDSDVVLVVSHQVGEETEKHGPNLLVHQLLRASLQVGRVG